VALFTPVVVNSFGTVDQRHPPSQLCIDMRRTSAVSISFSLNVLFNFHRILSSNYICIIIVLEKGLEFVRTGIELVKRC
jgi:hypothetical protein